MEQKTEKQKLSTPHGALGTRFDYLKNIENLLELSTPHGALGTQSRHSSRCLS